LVALCFPIERFPARESRQTHHETFRPDRLSGVEQKLNTVGIDPVEIGEVNQSYRGIGNSGAGVIVAPFSTSIETPLP
jgi:hypothetical protein